LSGLRTASGDLGQWWAEALGRAVVNSYTDELGSGPESDRPPASDVVRFDDSKKAEGRLHLDFRLNDQDAEAAVWWLVAHSLLISAP
jgi:hypothetical protein